MIIFQLLLYVAEVLSSLIDREWRPIRIEFLTLRGKPNTRMGSDITHTTFSLSSRLVDQGHPLDYRVRLLYTRMLRSSWTSSKRG